ncbi:MAG TPA: glycosyltransferase family 9 protein [Candidatus Sulfotelmatobacter sp.]|jgi:ADP-heptose:LPS heptosyltransferase|nr:glycosyltransferase family 9 protein [Candidatus Sulfotelmatobacter sp.]
MSGVRDRILVIRLGALGDLIYCFQAFHEIRQAHPGAEIALLVRKPFAAFAQAMPWFDKIIIDTHAKLSQQKDWWAQVREIEAFAPTRIYDLQGKRRQTLLFWSLKGPWGPEWSGEATFAHFGRLKPEVTKMHFTDFVAGQLRMAGVPPAGPADTVWLDAPVDHLNLPKRFAALIPGCTPKAAYKRWPPAHYAELARRIMAAGVPCAVIGTKDDLPVVDAIRAEAPGILNLAGKTSLFELAGVLRRAAVAVGNDTGPMHMAAAVGTPTLALFSQSTSPPWSRPLGDHADWLRSANLDDLAVETVWQAVKSLPGSPVT